MPGPKMGVRPPDFDEDLVRKAPTFQKWLTLKVGEKIRYACRDFQKGLDDDEERLMRRIMIARRNNVRDHEMLKNARAILTTTNDEEDNHHPPGSALLLVQDSATSSASLFAATTASNNYYNENPPPLTMVASSSALLHPLDEGSSILVKLDPSKRPTRTSNKKIKKRKIRSSSSLSLASNTSSVEAAQTIMDEAAVMATRSYKAWLALDDGRELSYNQKYIKGKEGHDFLLKKNIWRRMRYRRENKKMVQKLKFQQPGSILTSTATSVDAVGDARAPKKEEQLATAEEREQALNYPSTMSINATMPALDASSLEFDGSALDAAYKLAATTANVEEVAAAVAAAIQGGGRG